MLTFLKKKQTINKDDQKKLKFLETQIFRKHENVMLFLPVSLAKTEMADNIQHGQEHGTRGSTTDCQRRMWQSSLELLAFKINHSLTHNFISRNLLKGQACRH
jgi:hypothetical protein